ncbi:aminopeptidase N C-terminal domain-containing protein [Rickettsiella massiliensis]|uniref:aminopeptidase N C-terminal domain-containing protein n=1 Tax=Rickettsiella massiliensis TaxID=676517 RepID=UPI0002DDEACA|nr:aminopeptidase N C-terminal domain-containing protein [Rickettsiella massiliensis]
MCNPINFTTTLYAQRSLKNSVLSYLMLLNDPNIAALCFKQYQQADNLTDRLAALTALVHHQVPGYEDCLTSFLNRARDQSLIICKWFAVQAGSPQPGVLERVRLLCQHPAFDWKNPNKVSALLGTFCTKNLVQFHQVSGNG